MRMDVPLFVMEGETMIFGLVQLVTETLLLTERLNLDIQQMRL